ncbi:MAG TPA: pitrilysin family protein [Anaeromyxobacter sp.]|nr:pitrilysin family protein [Anaeromyxobacter sp.]
MSRRPAVLVLAAALATAVACSTAKKASAPAQPQAAPSTAQGAQAPAPSGPDRSAPPPEGPPPELRLPEQKHFALANGLKVRLVEYRRLPIVAVDLVALAGGGRDPASGPGLASFTATMLTEGTKTRTATQISDEAGFLGAAIHASAGTDAASLGGSTLSKHLAEFLALFADVAMHPAFRKADFERVQDERLVALLQQRDQPQALASRTFAPMFWGKHPYGHYLLGTEQSVKAFRPKDLAAFHERYWRPSNAELVVVGDVSEGELRPLLEKTLGAWKRGTPAPALPPAAPAAPKRAVLLEKADAPQAYLLLGMPGLRRSEPDYVASTVAFQVLGGGMSSRLFRNLREEKGYTYGIYARGDARKLAGVSFIAGSVKADVTGAAIAELLKEIDRIRNEPVGPDELGEAKSALVLGLPADFATAGAIAGRLADLSVHGLPDDYWNTYAEKVQKVAAEDVQRFARAGLDPSRLTAVLVANPSVVKPQLAGLPLGPLEEKAAPPSARARPTAAQARPESAEHGGAR